MIPIISPFYPKKRKKPSKSFAPVILLAVVLAFSISVFYPSTAFPESFDLAGFNEMAGEFMFELGEISEHYNRVKEVKKKMKTGKGTHTDARYIMMRDDVAKLVDFLRKLIKDMQKADPCDLEKLTELLRRVSYIDGKIQAYLNTILPDSEVLKAAPGSIATDQDWWDVYEDLDVKLNASVTHHAFLAIREQIKQYPEKCKKKPVTASVPSDTGTGKKIVKKGEIVNKGKLKITDASGKAKDAVVVEIPSDTAPPKKPIKKVAKDEPIKPESDYIVQADCHKAVKVKGKDLIEKAGVQLQHKPRRYRYTPCSKIDTGYPEGMYAAAKKVATDIEFGPKDFTVEGHFDKDPPYCELVIKKWKPKRCIKPRETPKRYLVGPDKIPDTGNPKGMYEEVKKIANDIEFGPKDFVLECHFDTGFPYCEIIVKRWCPKDEGACGTVTGEPASDTTLKDGKQTPTPGVADQVPTDDDPGVDDVPVIPLPPGTIIIIGNDPSGIQKKADTFPNDKFFLGRGSWGQAYFDQWGLRRIGFKPGKANESLWPEKASPIVVAVIDTGIDMFHPELLGALWRNEKEIPENGKDDDGNGYVDDVHGWNFVDKNNDIRDLNGHGTITSGIIAAWPDNSIGISGVNPWARIMPLKAMEWNGKGWAFDIADSIYYAVENGARVINISLGGKKLNRAELMAVRHARRKGVIIIAAAGNEGENTNNFSPAGLPGVVTVAATDTEDKRVGYSSWGPGVDIAAPGVDILSLRARRTDLLKFEKEDYKPGTAFVGKGEEYYRITGTSFAAPYVSGVASLILSINPNLTHKQVIRMILHSAKDIDIPGWDQFTGYGLLDTRAALKADPDFYIISRILKVKGTKEDGKFFIGISGRARADKFSRAWIEAGKGKNPKKWKKVSDDIKKPVNRGRLAMIPPARLKGSDVWTLRLVVEHKNGSRRVSTYDLKLK